MVKRQRQDALAEDEEQVPDPAVLREERALRVLHRGDLSDGRELDVVVEVVLVAEQDERQERRRVHALEGLERRAADGELVLVARPARGAEAVLPAQDEVGRDREDRDDQRDVPALRGVLEDQLGDLEDGPLRRRPAAEDGERLQVVQDQREELEDGGVLEVLAPRVERVQERLHREEQVALHEAARRRPHEQRRGKVEHVAPDPVAVVGDRGQQRQPQRRLDEAVEAARRGLQLRLDRPHDGDAVLGALALAVAEEVRDDHVGVALAGALARRELERVAHEVADDRLGVARAVVLHQVRGAVLGEQPLQRGALAVREEDEREGLDGRGRRRGAGRQRELGVAHARQQLQTGAHHALVGRERELAERLHAVAGDEPLAEAPRREVLLGELEHLEDLLVVEAAAQVGHQVPHAVALEQRVHLDAAEERLADAADVRLVRAGQHVERVDRLARRARLRPRRAVPLVPVERLEDREEPAVRHEAADPRHGLPDARQPELDARVGVEPDAHVEEDAPDQLAGELGDDLLDQPDEVQQRRLVEVLGVDLAEADGEDRREALADEVLLVVPLALDDVAQQPEERADVAVVDGVVERARAALVDREERALREREELEQREEHLGALHARDDAGEPLDRADPEVLPPRRDAPLAVRAQRGGVDALVAVGRARREQHLERRAHVGEVVLEERPQIVLPRRTRAPHLRRAQRLAEAVDRPHLPVEAPVDPLPVEEAPPDEPAGFRHPQRLERLGVDKLPVDVQLHLAAADPLRRKHERDVVPLPLHQPPSPHVEAAQHVRCLVELGNGGEWLGGGRHCRLFIVRLTFRFQYRFRRCLCK